MEQFKIFDSHFHIIDKKFPLVENNGFMPEEFNVENYKTTVKNLNVVGGAVVSGSFQEFDQSYLINALKILGEKFVGVTQIPSSISDEEIIKLHNCGIRAIRFNVKRGGSASIHEIESFGNRVYELVKWHTEIYIDSTNLKDLIPKISKLKKFSIDHLGLSKEGLEFLKKLVEKGGIVKATGFGRINFDPIKAIHELIKINPNSVIFGTDLPSTRAPIPFSENDVKKIINNFETNDIHNILLNNAKYFYNINI
ncbi:2-pyrone-4,6-dicarboxylate hydrolase [Silvanigrella paludirubra]|uniref:2-pyrone-4,6-dicarboxylate hydrolase n=1 Tax=Silvanigrella paludirubra TaxID=2499159 RepID=A0A6N6VU64_9BACT|nr:amidohydrolase family protein [Silvanigrella paludirubra]KAB8039870.1 2-pyrone-4,6-dicarboxylate hydrolase [Silvanigrella paludirubra]